MSTQVPGALPAVKERGRLARPLGCVCPLDEGQVRPRNGNRGPPPTGILTPEGDTHSLQKQEPR